MAKLPSKNEKGTREFEFSTQRNVISAIELVIRGYHCTRTKNIISSLLHRT